MVEKGQGGIGEANWGFNSITLFLRADFFDFFGNV